jgi:hypothetical protein
VTLCEQILAAAARLPEGTSLAAKELLHLGNRPAVDQALSRLVRRGRLLRAGRGVYVHPVKTRFGVRPPAPETVVKSVAMERGETVVPHGAVAANALGLTTQVPTVSIFLTSGPSRRLTLGKQVVELRHAPSWQLNQGRAGDAVRALAWIGEKNAPSAVRLFARKLSESERKELLHLRRGLPEWMAREVSALAAHG